MTPKCITPSLLLLIATCATAQEIVKDINATPGTQIASPNSYGQFCVKCGSYTYFYATDATHGRELWRTDGTTDGTQLVKDILEGANGTFPGTTGAPMLCRNNLLYIMANGIMRTDGTSEGTVSVDPSFVNGFIEFQGNIVYKDDGNLYMTTGEPGDKTLIYSFSQNPNEYTNTDIIATSDKVFTWLTRVSITLGAVSGYELWVYDGTQSQMLASFPPPLNTSIGSMTTAGDKILFVGYDATHGAEVWTSDGTVAGTQILVDIQPGTASSGALFSSTVNGKRIFTANDNNTWATDGTTAGTTKVITGFRADDIRELDTKLYLCDAASVKRSDLDFTNLENVVASSGEYILLLGDVGGKMLFTHSEPATGDEVFSVDASNNVAIVKDINQGANGSYARGSALVDSNIIFLADDGVHGFELWKTDGTDAGTSLIKDIANSTGDSKIGNIYQHNNKLYFLADATGEDFGPRQLWMSDGTEVGTTTVNDNHFYYLSFAPIGDHIVTLGDDSRTVLKTDLTSNTTSVMAAPANGFGGVGPNYSVAAGDNVYFYLSSIVSGVSTGLEVWKANPTTNEFGLLKDIEPGGESSGAAYGIKGAALNNKMIFTVHTSATDDEPWVTDGTEAGTLQLADINPDGSSYPDYYTTVGSHVVFRAYNPASGASELWTTDGTIDGTKALKSTDGLPFGLLNGKAVFTVTSSGNPSEIWMTDGSQEGTTLMAIAPYPWESVISFMNAQSKLYFVTKSELWVTDGTQEGTKMIAPIDMGFLLPGPYTTSGDMVIFHSNGKIYSSLGTPETTRVIANATPDGNPDDKTMYAVGNNVLFPMNDPIYGRELFKVAIPQYQDQTITFSGFDGMKVGNDQAISAVASSGLNTIIVSSDPTIAEIGSNNDVIVHKAGHVTFTASQNGSDTYRPVTASIEVDVAKGDQQITFDPIPAKKLSEGTFTITASASTNLPVSFTTSNTATGRVTISGNVATMTAAGKVTIVAHQDGNDNFSAANPVSREVCINPNAPTLTLSQGANTTITSSATHNIWYLGDQETTFTGKSISITEEGVYKAVAVVDGCQSDKSAPINAVILGLEEESRSIGVYPNPTEKNITVRNPYPSQIKIIDMAGKEQVNQTIGAGESIFDVSSFAVGFYVVVIKDHLATHHVKFVKR